MASRSWSHVLYLAIVLLLMANLVVMVIGKPKPAYAAAAPRQYQYKLINAGQTPEGVQRELDEAGAQGWKYEGYAAGGVSYYPFLVLSK